LEVKQIETAKRKGRWSQADTEDDNNNQPMKRQWTLPLMLKNVSSTKLCNALAEYVI